MPFVPQHTYSDKAAGDLPGKTYGGYDVVLTECQCGAIYSDASAHLNAPSHVRP